MSKFYITTAIAYVNAAPHVGHALEFIQADVLARYHRLKGDDTFYLTGTDEHGVKIYETAQEAKMDTQEFVDMNAEKFKALEGLLNLSNDDFVRTSDEAHKKGAQKIWMKMFEAGDIYKGKYSGNYCVGCESFIPEKDLVDGMCATHKKKPKQLEEENYFFKLSKYSNQIKQAIESDKLRVVPDSRKNEIINIIGEEGLRDVSFSRPKEVLPWGVNVPNDEDQVMYVWCDALSNYITKMDYQNEGERWDYWPADVHLIGKDILRFHAGIWIGMLMSAGIDLPKAIYVHGFVTSEGQKMSKSLGNVKDPVEYSDKYGTDAVRWFLMREIPTADDGDFSHSRFLEVHNSELANGLGNLVNRVVMMTEKYADGIAPAECESSTVWENISNARLAYEKHMDQFDIKKACEDLVELIAKANKYIDDKKPWIMAKEGNQELMEVIYSMLEFVRVVGILAYTIIPNAAEKVAAQIGMNVEDFDLDLKWGGIKQGTRIQKGDVLFPRLEE